jgi:hypothetical protein
MRIDLVGKGPIIFEGVELPAAAKGFDSIPFWDELSDETCDWLMSLHYCWGRTRQLSSHLILGHVKLLRKGFEIHQSNATTELRRRFPDATEEELQEVVADWHKALAIIQDCAERAKICRWTIIADDESLEANLKLMIKLLRDGVDGVGAMGGEIQGIEFRIRSLSREKQLEMLATFTDSFSKKQPWWKRLGNSIFRR